VTRAGRQSGPGAWSNGSECAGLVHSCVSSSAPARNLGDLRFARNVSDARLMSSFHPPQTHTHVRYWVIVFAATLAVVHISTESRIIRATDISHDSASTSVNWAPPLSEVALITHF